MVKTKQDRPQKGIGLGLLLGLSIGIWSGYEYARSTNPILPVTNLETNQVKVCFTPGNDCLSVIEKAINQAKKQILVQAYAFTAPTIVNALIAAHQRGVSVRILVDRSQLTGKGSKLATAHEHGLPIAIDQVPGIAHNKVILIDDYEVITGSFNWSNAAAYKNAENLLLIHNQELHQLYRNNWEKRAASALPYQR